MVFADYLRFHFSVSQPKALRSRVRGYLSELRRATCPEESHLSFFSHFSSAEFLAATTSLSLSTATGLHKVAFPMLKAPSLLRLGFFSLWQLILAALALLVGLNLSLVIGKLRGFSKSQKSLLSSPSGCSARIHSWPRIFSLFINDLSVSLSSSVSYSLYTDNLAIWSSFSSIPTSVEVKQGALMRLERQTNYWCLPLNPRKCKTSFFLVDTHRANLHPNLHQFNSRLRLNPIPTSLGVTFDRTLSFSNHESLLKAKFFPRHKALRCISASSWGPSLF